MRPSRSTSLLAALSLLTAGLIFGLGFVAAGSKFLATKPSTLDLLDVGRIQFLALHILEAVLIPTICLFSLVQSKPIKLISMMTACLFLIQMFVILPGLDIRMSQRLAGESPPPTWHHDAYMVVAGVMTLSILAIGLFATGLFESRKAAATSP